MNANSMSWSEFVKAVKTLSHYGTLDADGCNNFIKDFSHFSSSLAFLFCYIFGETQESMYVKKRAVCILCACLINLPKIRINEFVFVHVCNCTTVPPKGSSVPQCWFMSMCYGLGWLTRDWLWTAGQPASQPAGLSVMLRELMDHNPLGKVNTSLPLPTPPAWLACREKSHSGSQQEAWKHRARAAAKNHTQGKPGRVPVSLDLLSVVGCMDSSNDRLCVYLPVWMGRDTKCNEVNMIYIQYV